MPVPAEDIERLEELVARLGDDIGGRRGAEIHPVDVALSLGTYRVLALDDPERLGSVLVGTPLAEKQETLASFALASAGIAVLGVLGSGVIGWMLVRRSLRPLEEVSAAAAGVAALPLGSGEVSLADQRLPAALAEPGTEVGDVGHALNSLLDNVDSALTARQHSETRLRQFVADASHELRTPLAAVRGYTDMLQLTEPLTDNGQASLGRVEQQALRMSAPVEDLLLARLDEGRAPQMRGTDLAELMLEALTDASAAGPDHRWSLDVPDQPVPVRADPAQLREVLANLPSNARKHIPPGTAVTAAVTTADGWAEASVLDEGPGIPAEFQDQLFERFSRLDTSRQTREGSTGLGLSIVRSVVTAHDGTSPWTPAPATPASPSACPSTPPEPRTGTGPLISSSHHPSRQHRPEQRPWSWRAPADSTSVTLWVKSRSPVPNRFSTRARESTVPLVTSSSNDRMRRHLGRRGDLQARRSRPGFQRAHRSRPIVLLGIDGAGKTTTAAALVAAEREAGGPAIVLRNRSGRRWLARASARAQVDLPVRWADWIETVLRTANVLVAQARAAHRDGLVVIDRHLVCQLVLRKVRGLPPGRVLPWLAGTLLRADAVVVLDLPAETAQERILTRAEDHETLTYLRAARSAYLDLARAQGWSVVDATATTETVLTRIENATS
ncbi:ATP-binding protein [Kocuria arenosa]|uniref:ATP-binding protein n=1 Tax=Kocuria arenosa TaxID=3071446 RepID=UPI0034D47EC5